VQHIIHWPFHRNRLRHIEQPKPKGRIASQMGDIPFRPGQQVIQRKNFEPFSQQPVAKVRPNKPGSAGNQCTPSGGTRHNLTVASTYRVYRARVAAKSFSRPINCSRFRAELSLNRFHAVETDTMASRSLIEIECSRRDEAARVISAFT